MIDFMKEALKEARKSYLLDEVPIGAVIVINGKIISRGHNTREKSQNALHHAELIAIDKACKKLKSWRLDNAEMFVTLEPCPMCAGAITNARIKTVTIACKEKTSEDNLCEKIFSSQRLNFNPTLIYDEKYNNEASSLLSNFFKSKRKQ